MIGFFKDLFKTDKQDYKGTILEDVELEYEDIHDKAMPKKPVQRTYKNVPGLRGLSKKEFLKDPVLLRAGFSDEVIGRVKKIYYNKVVVVYKDVTLVPPYSHTIGVKTEGKGKNKKLVALAPVVDYSNNK